MGILRNYLGRVLRKLTRHRSKKKRHSWSSYEPEELDMDGSILRYKPDGMDGLLKVTKFNKTELQRLYRGYKQVCPSGAVSEDGFKQIYQHFFPQGDSSRYAQHIFRSFDQDQTGALNFEDFAVGLSVLSRGTIEEKLNWVFQLYDVNCDGQVTRDDMFDLVSSVYDLMGKTCCPAVGGTAVSDHVSKMFGRLDLNQDGVITLEEFVGTLLADEEIGNALLMFDRYAFLI